VLDLQDEGQPAWCFGIEAQRATGWAATDWVENLLVRQAGPDVYRRWILGEIPFDDSRIQRSFEWFATTVLQPQRVAGGVNGVLSTPVDSANAPLFSDPPGCVLHQQASFALSWFPSGTGIGPDGDLDFFVLPGTDADEPAPLVVGSDTIVPFRTRPQVESVLRFLTTTDSVATWVGAGGFLSPLGGVDDDAYPDAERLIADRIAGTETVVLDASDSMPPDIGADLFLTEITGWIAGTESYEDMAIALDEARTAPTE
jgi:alpha-glucoside transport system substrate-binding protein